MSFVLQMTFRHRLFPTRAVLKTYLSLFFSVVDRNVLNDRKKEGYFRKKLVISVKMFENIG